MKKDRNTFFESSNMNMAFLAPQMPEAPIPMMMPGSAQAQASQSFYANTNPVMPLPVAPQMASPTVGYQDSNINELESRMAKLERSINRLESRLSKLEGTYFTTTDTFETTTNGMYMV